MTSLYDFLLLFWTGATGRTITQHGWQAQWVRGFGVMKKASVLVLVLVLALTVVVAGCGGSTTTTRARSSTTAPAESTTPAPRAVPQQQHHPARRSWSAIYYSKTVATAGAPLSSPCQLCETSLRWMSGTRRADQRRGRRGTRMIRAILRGRQCIQQAREREALLHPGASHHSLRTGN